jgi:hypothetical protein
MPETEGGFLSILRIFEKTYRPTYDSHEKALVKGRRGDLGFPLHLTLIRTL